MAKNLYKLKLSMDKKEKRTAAQQGTKDEAMEMLRGHNIVLIVRPTGFGKTFTLLDIAKDVIHDNNLNKTENHSKKVLYLYPNNIIKESVTKDYFNPGAKEEYKMKFIPEDKYKEYGKVYPELPVVQFCSYHKFGMDYQNPYRAMGQKASQSREFDKLSEEKKLAIRTKWLKDRIKDFSLIIFDEAHRVGADKTIAYFETLREMCQNKEICIVGATATPLRTDSDVNLYTDIFYYKYGKKHIPAKVNDFSLDKCWSVGLLPQPYYSKAILDTDKFKEDMMNIIEDYYINDRKNKEVEKKRGRKPKAQEEVKTYSLVDTGRMAKIEEETLKMEEMLAKVRDPESILYDAVMTTAKNRFLDGKYMRFLIFYQDTNDMIECHSKINSIFRSAFKIGKSNSDYKTLNEFYLVSNEESLVSSGVSEGKLIKTDDITEKDKELGKNFSIGDGCIDLIHCIQILNMGYHVEDVTGVIIKRKTGSEIIFYQQIGRSMSVTSDETPLIIDFENADSELYRSAGMTPARSEAVDRIQEFVNGCNLSPDCNIMNEIFKMINKHVATDKLPTDMLEYLYFDRHMPIYFIKGIAEATKCNETVESIIDRLKKIQAKRDDLVLQPDSNFVNFQRLSKKLIGTDEKPGILTVEDAIFDNLSIKARKDDSNA